MTSAKSEEKIKSYDYAKWDAFDVDKAMADIDKVPRITDITDDDPMPAKEDEFQLQQRAVAEKERGNEHFRCGRYIEAVQAYTKGMQCDPRYLGLSVFLSVCVSVGTDELLTFPLLFLRNAILPANRAMSLLKLKNFAEAERDCTLALSLDPTYAKALQRRGTAR